MKIFCSGVGGIGLSAYAAHMRARGHDVSGSDRSDSPLLHDLKSQGIRITLLQDGSGLPDNLDLFVYSEAIPEDAPEREEAGKRGVRRISYFQALGEMTAGTDLIAVCGTHGKSSTTAMAALMLIEAGLDPNVVVGTKLKFLGGRNWRKGTSKLWIVEACEYRRSFLHLQATSILLTNADGDHFDAFTGQDDYRHAFIEFFRKLPREGVVIAHGTDAVSMQIIRSSGQTFMDADREQLPEMAVPGLHMKQNAQLVLALAKYVKIPDAPARAALKTYAGSWRRMEVKGTTADGVTVIDDYAHHPAEIRATLQAMREAFPKRRIVAVFQPHTHDRTLKLWDEFATSLTDADEVVLASVYDARPDRDRQSVDEKAFAEAIRKGSGIPTEHGGSLNSTETLLRTKILKPNDVLVVMGAGDSTELADAIISGSPARCTPDPARTRSVFSS